jgi:hypothetical protein
MWTGTNTVHFRFDSGRFRGHVPIGRGPGSVPTGCCERSFTGGIPATGIRTGSILPVARRSRASPMIYSVPWTSSP